MLQARPRPTVYWSDIGMTFTGAQVEYTYSELKN